jgi:hypothetical protein
MSSGAATAVLKTVFRSGSESIRINYALWIWRKADPDLKQTRHLRTINI